jgi:hypothetical protein
MIRTVFVISFFPLRRFVTPAPVKRPYDQNVNQQTKKQQDKKEDDKPGK